MNETDSIENLRQKITELKQELADATFEKGLAADENKDLRENFAYDYWDQKERVLLNRIHGLIREIADRTPKPPKPTPKKKILKQKPVDETEIVEPKFPINKWL